MAERKRPQHNPYQASFDFAPHPQETGRFVYKLHDGPQLHAAKDAADYLLNHVYTPFELFDQEEAWALLLDTKYHITHTVMAYRGTVNTIWTRPVEYFKEALRVNASSIIMSHCHPSGDPTPSPEDVRVTEVALEISKILDIALLDHIIVGKNKWVSLKERGLGFESAREP